MDKKPNYLDTTLSPEERAADLLSKMTIEQKLAQMRCAYVYEAVEKVTDGIGQLGTLFYQADSAAQMAADMERIQRHVIESSAFGIPAIIHCEALTGAVVPQGTTFQSGIGQAASWDPGSVKKMADTARQQFLAVGVRQAFAPVMDIARDPRWGRIGETYGEDPTLAAAMSVAGVTGMQGENLTDGVAATSKHFLAYGASEAGINMASTPVTERTLREVYAKPFQAAITEGKLASVMNSYGCINGEPVVISKRYLNDLLREEMGFDGAVVSDYTSIGYLPYRFHVGNDLTEVGKQALEAGLDVECPQPLGYGDGLLEEIKAGRVDMALVDQACKRILTEKFRLGLFEHPYPRKEELEAAFHSAQVDALCLENAQKSLVLLKNNGLLPLKKQAHKIAVIGPHADSLRQLFGCYTWPAFVEMYADFAVGAMAGTETADAAANASTGENRPFYPGSKLKMQLPQIEPELRKNLPQAMTVLQAIKATCPEAEVRFAQGYNYTGNDMTQLDEALELAHWADVTIATVGGKYGWGATVTTGECMDAADVGLPGMEDEAVRQLICANPNTVLLHFDSRAFSDEYAQEHAAAILECWNPGTRGAEAITSVLFGDYNPGGKLPVTVVRDSRQIPMYYNHDNGSSYSRGAYLVDGYTDDDGKPLYVFGHGLSYTSFAYKNMQLSASELSGNQSLTVTADVRNTGDRAGDEVVQLYIRDLVSSLVRPVQQLAGFRRVHLEPGQKKTVRFTIRLSQLAFLDIDMRWKVEAGAMEVQLGASCQDIRLTAPFTIRDDSWVDGKTRGFYAETEEVEMM